jgi:hypothetical protein
MRHCSKPVVARAAVPPADTENHQQFVPVAELLTLEFVRRHTRFSNLDELLSACGVPPEALPDPSHWALSRLNALAIAASRFADWNALVREAGAEWLIRRMGIHIDA